MRSFSLLLTCLLFVSVAFSQSKNGFELSNTSIPVDLIKAGGPPKDGIPAIDQPKFESAAEANWLHPNDRILGISISNQAKAYPIRILNWHEIVNDQLADQPIVVTYCPLCGTGMVFDSNVSGQTQHFGVSGLLFQSDVLLYDRATESLWSQIWMSAVSGAKKGQNLSPIAAEHTTWERWQKEHSNTLVLSRDTGFNRDYSKNPYAGYATSSRLYFDVENKDERFGTKSWVMGLVYKGETKAYPFEVLDKKPARFVDQVGGDDLTIVYDSVNQTASVFYEGDQLPTLQAFWFAWYAFYPETLVLD